MTDRGRSHKTIRRLRKSYIVRFARAYRKAPIVIRLQVGLVILVGFFLSIAAIIGAVSLFSGRSDDASMRSSSGSGTDVTETAIRLRVRQNSPG
ncbi:MAG: hypothetical protein J6P16_03960 [Eubacterium sp.]|nr:hypothetical protein [Eubacterium sp.]